MAKNSVYTADAIDPQLTVKAVLEKIDEFNRQFSLPPANPESPTFRKELSESFKAFVMEPSYVDLAMDNRLSLNFLAEFAPLSSGLKNFIHEKGDLISNELDVCDLPSSYKSLFKELNPRGLRTLTFAVAISQALKDLGQDVSHPALKYGITEDGSSHCDEAASCAGRLLMEIGANPSLAETGAKLLAEALDKFEKLAAAQLKM